jgi:ABC-type dipeptide/oligopeptide/nickel transport system permease component
MSVIRLIRRRLVAAVVLVLATVSLTWWLTRSAPGQATLFARDGFLADDSLAATEAREASGQSLWSWWMAASRLDLGRSAKYQRPVLPLVAERAANSALLALAALALALAVGLPMGILSSRSRGWAAQAIRVFSVITLSCPPLVVAIVLAWLAVRWGWQLGGTAPSGGGVDRAVALARILGPPALALAIPLAATFERMQSRSLARVLGEPCLRAAAARGLDERAVWWRAWWLALPPVASVGGLIAGALLGGALSVEIVTAWPGLGRLAFDALLARDAPLVAGCALMTSVFVSVAALASDLLVAWADPRSREES